MIWSRCCVNGVSAVEGGGDTLELKAVVDFVVVSAEPSLAKSLIASTNRSSESDGAAWLERLAFRRRDVDRRSKAESWLAVVESRVESDEVRLTSDSVASVSGDDDSRTIGTSRAAKGPRALSGAMVDHGTLTSTPMESD